MTESRKDYIMTRSDHRSVWYVRSLWNKIEKLAVGIGVGYFFYNIDNWTRSTWRAGPPSFSSQTVDRFSSSQVLAPVFLRSSLRSGGLGPTREKMGPALIACACANFYPKNLVIETVQTTIMSGWNKRQISNWSSAGYLKRVQFYNWFRLHQILYQL